MYLDLVQQIEKFITSTITKYHTNPTINIFDQFVNFCQEYYDRPMHSIADMKIQKNTKIKGDIFELFAQKYLKYCHNKNTFTEVWLLKEVPNNILEKLGLKNNDLGIDLIAVDDNQKYYAIQVKYRKKTYKKIHGIGWKELSTFYGLVNRSGPWERYIVITNANYVRHVGKKIKKDLSICYGTLCKITIDQWCKMVQIQGYKLGLGNDISNAIDNTNVIDHATILNNDIKNNDIEKEKDTNVNFIREKRLAYFTK